MNRQPVLIKLIKPFACLAFFLSGVAVLKAKENHSSLSLNVLRMESKENQVSIYLQKEGWMSDLLLCLYEPSWVNLLSFSDPVKRLLNSKHELDSSAYEDASDLDKSWSYHLDTQFDIIIQALLFQDIHAIHAKGIKRIDKLYIDRNFFNERTYQLIINTFAAKGIPIGQVFDLSLLKKTIDFRSTASSAPLKLGPHGKMVSTSYPKNGGKRFIHTLIDASSVLSPSLPDPHRSGGLDSWRPLFRCHGRVTQPYSDSNDLIPNSFVLRRVARLFRHRL